jgi:acyl-CoA thioester hydrolase
MWYVGKFDEATWNLVSLFGATQQYMKSENKGMVAAGQRIVYRKELLPGNLVHVRSGLHEVKEKTIRFFHEMINSDTGEVAAITWLNGVHIDSQLRRAAVMPVEMRKKAEGLITDYQPQ